MKLSHISSLLQPKIDQILGELLIRTHAVGVNYADCVIRMGIVNFRWTFTNTKWQGLYSSAKKYVGWPITPGFEFSGIVEEIGPNSAGI